MTLRRRVRTSRIVPISRLPAHILLEVINKMNNRQLVRMRQTCQYVNSFAVSYEKELASRPALGSTIIFEYYKNEDQLCFQTMEYGPETAVVEEDFVKSMAGISFRKINVEIHRDRDGFHQILKIFNRMRPVCKELIMPHCPLDLIVPITDCVTFQEDFNATYLLWHVKNKETQNDAVNVLSILREAKNCSKFCFYIPYYIELTEGVYDKVKDFLRLSVETNASGFEELLWDLHKSEKRITLKSMSISFREHYSVFDPRKLPPFLKILKPVGSKEDVPDVQVPAAVYLLTLKSQFVFIFEIIIKRRQEIHITEKTAEAMEEQIMSIYSDPRYARTKDNKDEDEYEYYEDENDEHEEDREVFDRGLRHIILKRNARAIVESLKSLMEE